MGQLVHSATSRNPTRVRDNLHPAGPTLTPDQIQTINTRVRKVIEDERRQADARRQLGQAQAGLRDQQAAQGHLPLLALPRRGRAGGRDRAQPAHARPRHPLLHCKVDEDVDPAARPTPDGRGELRSPLRPPSPTRRTPTWRTPRHAEDGAEAAEEGADRGRAGSRGRRGREAAPPPRPPRPPTSRQGRGLPAEATTAEAEAPCEAKHRGHDAEAQSTPKRSPPRRPPTTPTDKERGGIVMARIVNLQDMDGQAPPRLRPSQGLPLLRRVRPGHRLQGPADAEVLHHRAGQDHPSSDQWQLRQAPAAGRAGDQALQDDRADAVHRHRK